LSGEKSRPLTDGKGRDGNRFSLGKLYHVRPFDWLLLTTWWQHVSIETWRWSCL